VLPHLSTLTQKNTVPQSIANSHSRPQLTRMRWTDLGGDWGFAHDDESLGLDARWMERTAPYTRTILVPFP